MKTLGWSLALCLALAGCRDFGAAVDECIAQGRCVNDAGAGGGSGGGTGGGSGGGNTDGGTGGGSGGGNTDGGTGGGSGGGNTDGGTGGGMGGGMGGGVGGGTGGATGGGTGGATGGGTGGATGGGTGGATGGGTGGATGGGTGGATGGGTGGATGGGTGGATGGGTGGGTGGATGGGTGGATGGGTGGATGGGTGGATGGGTGGATGGGTGGAGGGGAPGCSPACSASNECSGTVCVPRYSALTFVLPDAGATYNPNNLPLRVDLGLAAGRTANNPPTLPVTFSGPGSANATVTAAGLVYTGSTSALTAGTWTATATFADAGLMASTSFTIASPPSFSVALAAPPGRADAGAVTVDPAGAAFRRNEELVVRVTSGGEALASTVVTGALVYADGGVHGELPDGGAWLARTLAGCPADPDSGVACPTDGGACACYALELWRPVLDDLRANASVTVTGSNAFALSTNVNAGPARVTRFKWSRALAARETPAIGTDGRLFVTGTTLSALSPEGALLWTSAAVSANAPVFLAPDAGPALIGFHSRVGTVTTLGTVDAADGGVITGNTCSFTNVTCGLGSGTLFEPVGAPFASWSTPTFLGAVLQIGSQAGISCPAPTLTYQLQVSRLSGAGTTTCQTSPLGGAPEIAPVAPVASGTRIVIPRADGVLEAKDVGATITAAAGFTNVTQTSTIAGLALGDSAGVRSIIATAQGASTSTLFRAPLLTGGAPAFSRQTPQPKAWCPAVSTLSQVFFGSSGNGTELDAASTLAMTPTVSTLLSGRVDTAPVLGEGGLLYAVDASGIVRVHRAADLTPLWSAPLGTGLTSTPLNAPNIDCGRNPNGTVQTGRPGTLYVVLGGTVYATLVDSAGIDATAQWPRYQHDPANTGDLDTPLSVWSCP